MTGFVHKDSEGRVLCCAGKRETPSDWIRKVIGSTVGRPPYVYSVTVQDGHPVVLMVSGSVTPSPGMSGARPKAGVLRGGVVAVGGLNSTRMVSLIQSWRITLTMPAQLRNSLAGLTMAFQTGGSWSSWR